MSVDTASTMRLPGSVDPVAGPSVLPKSPPSGCDASVMVMTRASVATWSADWPPPSIARAAMTSTVSPGRISAA